MTCIPTPGANEEGNGRDPVGTHGAGTSASMNDQISALWPTWVGCRRRRGPTERAQRLALLGPTSARSRSWRSDPRWNDDNRRASRPRRSRSRSYRSRRHGRPRRKTPTSPSWSNRAPASTGEIRPGYRFRWRSTPSMAGRHHCSATTTCTVQRACVSTPGLRPSRRGGHARPQRATSLEINNCHPTIEGPASFPKFGNEGAQPFSVAGGIWVISARRAVTGGCVGAVGCTDRRARG
jgi:hypothetical protein